MKSSYASDGKYLAVITNNGLWIKDSINNQTIITNSSYIEDNYLMENFITIFDKEFNVIKNIKSEKIDISSLNWIIHDSRTYNFNTHVEQKQLLLETNFDLKRIRTLYSNLSALDLFELYKLRENYKKLNYSLTDIDMHIIKLFTFPAYLFLMGLLSALIMLNIKRVKSSTFKIFVGLFFSVLIYYLNNFSYVLGQTERISLFFSAIIPLLVFSIVNIIMLRKVNIK